MHSLEVLFLFENCILGFGLDGYLLKSLLACIFPLFISFALYSSHITKKKQVGENTGKLNLIDPNCL